MKVGMYCYNKTNRKLGIGKIIDFQRNNNVNIRYKNDIELVTIGNVIASSDIIDLIEEGDILEINEEKYEVIYDESYEKLGILIPSRKELSIRHSALEYVFKKYEVAIVTKEQFEQMKYRIGEQDE